jgi:hypothetical protein
MTSFEVAIDAFHFIRPLWLLLLPVIVGLWWTVRRTRGRRDVPTAGIAPHLRVALTVGASEARRLLPIGGVALGLACLVAGAAGPTWSRMPDPFVAQSAPVVVVLKVTPSMQETDVAPSRLERGKQKIRDLLELRAGARTALVAYAGSAHGVVPMSEDPAVMTPYLAGLTPEVMPRAGDRAADALAIAEALLAQEDGRLPAELARLADQSQHRLRDALQEPADGVRSPAAHHHRDEQHQHGDQGQDAEERRIPESRADMAALQQQSGQPDHRQQHLAGGREDTPQHDRDANGGSGEAPRPADRIGGADGQGTAEGQRVGDQ